MSHHGNDIYWENKLEAMMEESIMGCEYCDYCGRIVDLDWDVEHWDDEEYEKGRDKWKCTVQQEDEPRRKLWWQDALRNDWGKQAQWGDAVNKKDKERREDAIDRINPQDHK